MDTETDFIIEGRDAILGISEAEFLRWLEYNVGIKVEFKADCWKQTQINMMDYLKTMWFDDFVDDRNYAYQSKNGGK